MPLIRSVKPPQSWDSETQLRGACSTSVGTRIGAVSVGNRIGTVACGHLGLEQSHAEFSDWNVSVVNQIGTASVGDRTGVADEDTRAPVDKSSQTLACLPLRWRVVLPADLHHPPQAINRHHIDAQLRCWTTMSKHAEKKKEHSYSRMDAFEKQVRSEAYACARARALVDRCVLCQPLPELLWRFFSHHDANRADW